MGKLDEGIAAYRKVLELAPSWVQLWGGLGAALAENGDADKAIDAFRRLAEMQPQNAQALKSLAELLLKVGKTREAISVLNNAMVMVLGDKELRELLHRAHNRGADRWNEACGAAGACKQVTTGPVPCSGARRRDKALDAVSAAILGDAVAENQQMAEMLRGGPS